MKLSNRFFTLFIICVFTLSVLIGSAIYKAGVNDGRKEAYATNQRINEAVSACEPEKTKSDHATVIEKEVEAYTEDDLYCLAAAVYQEAGGDAYTNETRRMVADVIINRTQMSGFPDTIREVLEDAPNGAMQYGLFSVTGVQFDPYRLSDEREQEAIMRSWWIAEDVLRGNHSALYGNGWCWQSEHVQGNEGFWREGIYFAK